MTVDMNHPLPPALTRRYFLGVGTRLLAVGGPLAMLGGLGWPRPAQAFDWRALQRGNFNGGHGTVKDMSGAATAAGRRLAVGARVASGEEVRVERDSHVILSLSDNTILRIGARTVFTLDVGTQRRGFFRLLVGAVLTVMPHGNRYLVQMPTATVGIKGTVFFHQIYHPDEHTATDEKGAVVRIPANVREYFCLCHGWADFLKGEAAQPFFTDESSYHNSYFIDPARADPMVKAPQLNHTDTQIGRLIELQDGVKNDADWLRKYNPNKTTEGLPG